MKYFIPLMFFSALAWGQHTVLFDDGSQLVVDEDTQFIPIDPNDIPLVPCEIYEITFYVCDGEVVREPPKGAKFKGPKKNCVEETIKYLSCPGDEAI